MSETDDTDDLLLIPPDFFSVGPDLETPYYNIVDSLITQVSHLQNRIQTIESTSDISLVGSYLDNTFDFTNTMNNSRKYSSSDDVYQSQSTQSTPQKPHTKIKSLPNTPSINRFSPRSRVRNMQKSSKSTENSPVLNEIDNFLSNVKTIQKINASRNLNQDFTNSTNEHQRHTTNNKKMSEIVEKREEYNTKLQSKPESVKEPPIVKENTWHSGDDIRTVPDYGTGMRDIMGTHVHYDSAKLNSSNDYGSSFVSNDKSDSSSDSTQLTAFNSKYNHDRDELMHSPLHANALNVLNQHKKLFENSGNLKEPTKKERVIPKGIHTLSDNVGLMSLADIWTNSGGRSAYDDSSKLLQKLEEEKLRRQHCETLIQNLQTKNLELQQKLAVAFKVDQSKNNTIQQFKEAVEKFAVKMEKCNKEKMSFEDELRRIAAQYKGDLAEARQKVSYYEKEISKALNLAHMNQDKVATLERKCLEQENELQCLEEKLKEFQEKYYKEFERNKHLSDIISKKEMEIIENKSTINNARSEVFQCKKAVEVCQIEMNSLKSECSKHQSEMKDDKNLIINLNEQKQLLTSEVDSYKNKEKALHDELIKLKKQLESNKVELRNFYQGQVEILVQNKLKEFQNQLDKTENQCKEEIKKRELSIAKTAASHIQQITEKFALEQQLVETKHNEELKLYQIQIMQQKQEIDGLHSKINAMQDKRHHIAKQLQKIMESQWNEALRIIANGKSPTIQEQQHFNTIDQLNSLKSQSYHNFEELLSQNEYEQNNYEIKRTKASDNYGHTAEDASHEDVNVVDTPVTSRQQKFSEAEMQKYINLLLNKPPGNPTAEAAHENQGTNSEKAWQSHEQEVSQNKQQYANYAKYAQKKFGKPPWK